MFVVENTCSGSRCCWRRSGGSSCGRCWFRCGEIRK